MDLIIVSAVSVSLSSKQSFLVFQTKTHLLLRSSPSSYIGGSSASSKRSYLNEGMDMHIEFKLIRL